MKTLTALLILLVTTTSASAIYADRVEMMLSNSLDGILDSYCLDISGSKQNADISKGLQTHTCYGYQGEKGIDQIFDSARLVDNLLYMPEFDVCATMSDLEPGASIGLAACNGVDTQLIALTDAGQLSPLAAKDLCLTAGDDTRFGRGGTSQHQIKTLTLEKCSEALADYQRWEIRH